MAAQREVGKTAMLRVIDGCCTIGSVRGIKTGAMTSKQDEGEGVNEGRERGRRRRNTMRRPIC